VTYTVSADQLTFEYTATTDKTAPINLTNHTYWNLSGECAADIKSHQLTLHASSKQADPVHAAATDPADPSLTLTDLVAGTPYDFTVSGSAAAPIGSRMAGTLTAGSPVGYDSVYVLDGGVGAGAGVGAALHPAAVLSDPSSGRVMDVATNQACIICYTANYLPPTAAAGESSTRNAHTQWGAVCLETINHVGSLRFGDLPHMLLQPGEQYHHKTVHTFRTTE
jgi:aldose 1-epimerase